MTLWCYRGGGFLNPSQYSVTRYNLSGAMSRSNRRGLRFIRRTA